MILSEQGQRAGPRNRSVRRTAAGRIWCAWLLFVLAVGVDRGLSADPVQAPRVAFVRVAASGIRVMDGGIGNTILANRYVAGMSVAVAELDDIAGTVRNVTEGFTCATDPVFHHDGSRLAFAGRRSPDEPLQIWEIVWGRSEAHRLVDCAADCISPVYMPDGRMVFSSLLSGEYEEHGGLYSFSLYDQFPGSGPPNRLTFSPSSEFAPAVLPDGRLLFSSWQHVGNHHWPRGVVALLLVNADGTGLFPLTGNHRDPWLKRGARPSGPDGIIFIQSDGHGEFGAGTLAATSLNDPFGPYRILVPANRWQVADASPLAHDRVILSARPSDGSKPTFGLYLLERGEMRLLYEDPEVHALTPVVSIAKPPPERRISTVVPGTPHGYLLVLNCYETDRPTHRPLNEDSVATVRVIEGRPLGHDGQVGPAFRSVAGRTQEPLIRPNSATGYIPARILGEVSPAADGSVYLKVPADTPLRMQFVDHEGFTVMNERAWFWVRPNERRACIGCHENRELAPANSVPLAARRAPTDLTDSSSWQTVSFRTDIQPILTATCAVSGCHVPPTPTAGMNLTAGRLSGERDDVLADRYGPAYANLLRRQNGKPFSVGGRRVHPGDARQSPMLWMLYGRALGSQYTPAPFERPMIVPHPGPMLPDEQLELIRKWIDLGAQYDDGSPAGLWPYMIAPASETEVILETG